MRSIDRSRFAFAMLGLALAIPPQCGASCIVYEAVEMISIEIAPGKSALLDIYAYASSGESGGCSAAIQIPLSSFPTSRLATRPADIARSMRDIVKKIGAKECEVQVYYENDTGEEIAEHELCLTETFEFGDRKHWSKSSEAYCWEPEMTEVEIVTLD